MQRTWVGSGWPNLEVWPVGEGDRSRWECLVRMQSNQSLRSPKNSLQH